MFHIRTIFPDQRRAETSTHPLVCTRRPARHASNLFDQFLHKRPNQFQDHLDFVDGERMELEWMAGPGEGAFVAFYSCGDPVSLGVLVPGDCDSESRAALLHTGRQYFEPLLGEDLERLTSVPGGPLMLMLVVPGRPELQSTLSILHEGLAACYFRKLREFREQQRQESGIVCTLPQVVEWDLPHSDASF